MKGLCTHTHTRRETKAAQFPRCRRRYTNIQTQAAMRSNVQTVDQHARCHSEPVRPPPTNRASHRTKDLRQQGNAGSSSPSSPPSFLPPALPPLLSVRSPLLPFLKWDPPLLWRFPLSSSYAFFVSPTKPLFFSPSSISLFCFSLASPSAGRLPANPHPFTLPSQGSRPNNTHSTYQFTHSQKKTIQWFSPRSLPFPFHKIVVRRHKVNAAYR